MSTTLSKQRSTKALRPEVRRHTRGPGNFKQAGGGVVRSYLSGKGGLGQLPPHTLSEWIRAGLPVQELKELQTGLAVSMEKLGNILGISRATLQRRLSDGRLDPAESDHLVRFARLVGKAIEVLESGENAREWLNAPQHGLGGAVPLEYAGTEVGAREVENLLGRIEYGVYS
jgi:putative toxin-antitoxin system antitoxin component (TIGR02293 family)